ncbi:hypothetical protein QN277_017595 [Acacia crassicarpa]|uniref:Uncharacterized protein n=1 Tax=Acacia crassicarpa TaxID=499986 RepID=A0AAE1JPE2_9FABA|nr:hypothetical protein QN277_017595 [Acacia crassicarpa]
MSGVWVFKNGVYRLVENPQAEASEGRPGKGSGSRKKVLVYLPTGQVVSSYSFLEQILTGLGWERDFSRFNSIYMYDIVIKNPNVFHVRDI